MSAKAAPGRGLVAADGPDLGQFEHRGGDGGGVAFFRGGADQAEEDGAGGAALGGLLEVHPGFDLGARTRPGGVERG